MRKALEKATERSELLRQPLRVVEPIDPDDTNQPIRRNGLVSRTLAHREVRQPDPNRKTLDGERSPGDPDAPVCMQAAECTILVDADQLCHVRARLHADEIVRREGFEKVPMLRDCKKRFRRRQRDVQEEPDRVADAEPPQHLCDGNEVEVVHPDNVVRLEMPREFACKALVDFEVTAIKTGIEPREIQPVVEHGPKNGVRIAR